MEGLENYFKGKKITQVGLGLLGRGLGDARFLAQMGAELIVTDLKTPEQLKPSLDALKEFKNIHFTLGHHNREDFRNRDLIINGPAVPLDSPYISEARVEGIPVTMSTALFARLARAGGATIAGITGTRGKTTTTQLLASIVRAAGLPTLLGGNIQGVSTLAQLPDVVPGAVAVLELDSWQLQGFRDEHLSPQVAVFTNFFPDHLNYYRGDLTTYLNDKAQIFLYQKEGDTLVLGEQVESIIEKQYAGRMPRNTLVAGAQDVPADWALKIPGEHNRENVACALAAARALKISEETIRAAVEAFRGVEGRLEFLREVRGVHVYNDTTATTPEATIAALRALDPKDLKNIVLIMGGADKGLNMTDLKADIARHCKKVVFLSGTGTERIHAEYPHTTIQNSLSDALNEAFASAEPGDSMLFSPAFASFGMFKNEYDRGDQFEELVEALPA